MRGDQLTFASLADDDSYWRDFHSRRPVLGGHLTADRFSPRAFRFAVPMAAAMWLIAAIVLRAYI